MKKLICLFLTLAMALTCASVFAEAAEAPAVEEAPPAPSAP